MKNPDSPVLSLRDYSTRDTKWDSDRVMADRVAQIYESDSMFSSRGERMFDCSRRLLFAPKVSRLTGEMKLALRKGEFCHVPFCPVCSRRRSLRWMRRLWEALPKLLTERPAARWLFMTLTVKNPPVEDTRETLKRMNAAWNRLVQRKEFRPVLGWLRTTEITYGRVPGCCHPHFHVLMMVPPSMLSGNGYVKHARWVEIWSECLRVDYEAGVDIRVVKQKQGWKRPDGVTLPDMHRAALESGVIETMKYTVKSSEVVRDPAWFLELARQTYGLRMVATGGRLKEVLKVDKPETDEDLIGADIPAELDEFEEQAFWLAFDWGRTEKRYKRNPEADRMKD
ncbi:protein rep [Escherichia coli]|nr:protein rep [Escherichia coli]EEU2238874.1 protein rep [Escherichia coli]EEY2618224.1 protein rep [Escherichia coli]EEZ2709047.1 protein rep [Escherichia coli]EFG1399572.1 protein rep [Escherichia coli]